ncbi:MAG: class C beta-lactamase-related serine hydrolase [Chloroflexota bacterium]|nr:MAG: class C beta-lactamase-related serine hydrolase [Chloroflexota bacterium]
MEYFLMPDPQRPLVPKKLISKLEQTALETKFSGVISIYQDSTSVFNQAFGYRDIKNQLPNLTTTLFGTASGTKTFTALGIGKLIDQGLISLNTAVGEINPDYTNFIDPGATILQLLTHTSGIYDYYDEEVNQDSEKFFVEIPWYKLGTTSDYYPLFRNQVMKFQPGEKFSYSNGGYVFLGILLEKLTGGLYRDFIFEPLLKPALMKRSNFYALNDLPANTAQGYLNDRQTTNIYNIPVRGSGDGGMFTTTDDLHLFWDQLFTYKILSKELTDLYFRTYHRFNDLFGYGCGIYKRLDHPMYSISGSDAGVGFESRYLVTDKVTINILSNITEGDEDIRPVVREIINCLIGK